jgi:hypothetical protein
MIDSKPFDGVHATTYPRLMKRRVDGCIGMWTNDTSGVVLWHEKVGLIGSGFAHGDPKAMQDWDMFNGTLTLRNA